MPLMTTLPKEQGPAKRAMGEIQRFAVRHDSISILRKVQVAACLYPVFSYIYKSGGVAEFGAL